MKRQESLKYREIIKAKELSMIIHVQEMDKLRKINRRLSDKIKKLTSQINTALFTADDIKEAYELGRVHEEKNSDCTGDIVKKVYLESDKLHKIINWEQ